MAGAGLFDDGYEERKLRQFNEKVDLVERALAELTRIECDCGRILEIERYVDRKDIEQWVEENES